MENTTNKVRKPRSPKKNLLPSQNKKSAQRFYVYVDADMFSRFESLMKKTSQGSAACGRLVFARGLMVLADEWDIAA